MSFGAGDNDFWLVKISDIVPVTWVVDDDGPADFSSIQQAIDAAGSGDTILVSSGTYYENLLVDKAVSLLGQGASQTIIDGTFSGNVIAIASENVIVDGFTIEHGAIIDPQNYNDYGAGVALLQSNCTIRNNIITNCNYGILFPNDATIENNEITNITHHGILIQFSGNNLITDNNVTSVGLYFTSGNVLRNNQVTDYFAVYASGSDVDTSNTLKGRPIYFLQDQTDATVPSDAGLVVLVNCANITVNNLNLVGQIYLSGSNNCSVIGNSIAIMKSKFPTPQII
jgi:parallel beta-helix repeat protein